MPATLQIGDKVAADKATRTRDKDQILHIQAGAGIVADSVPACEWEETMNKGRAIFQAVTLAGKGLNQCGQSGS